MEPWTPAKTHKNLQTTDNTRKETRKIPLRNPKPNSPIKPETLKPSQPFPNPNQTLNGTLKGALNSTSLKPKALTAMPAV